LQSKLQNTKKKNQLYIPHAHTCQLSGGFEPFPTNFIVTIKYPIDSATTVGLSLLPADYLN
jgi:hypothetical protein